MYQKTQFVGIHLPEDIAAHWEHLKPHDHLLGNLSRYILIWPDTSLEWRQTSGHNLVWAQMIQIWPAAVGWSQNGDLQRMTCWTFSGNGWEPESCEHLFQFGSLIHSAARPFWSSCCGSGCTTCSGSSWTASQTWWNHQDMDTPPSRSLYHHLLEHAPHNHNLHHQDVWSWTSVYPYACEVDLIWALYLQSSECFFQVKH